MVKLADIGRVAGNFALGAAVGQDGAVAIRNEQRRTREAARQAQGDQLDQRVRLAQLDQLLRAENQQRKDALNKQAVDSAFGRFVGDGIPAVELLKGLTPEQRVDLSDRLAKRQRDQIQLGLDNLQLRNAARPEGYTLGPGQVRIENGRRVGQGPDKPPPGSGLTAAQTANNAEIDAARKNTSHLSLEDAKRKILRVLPNGMPNPAYDPVAAQAVRTAIQHKVGDDPEFGLLYSRWAGGAGGAAGPIPASGGWIDPSIVAPVLAGKPGGGGVPSINTPEEHAALPSGTEYIDAATGQLHKKL
ncbi:MAG: hypothetical protein OEW11_11220 [Nitrospirota bacterium]|nr:hypothetical protein [Nitrospirota bacterium]